MQMRIHRLDQFEVELVGELDITVVLLEHRIDDQRFAAAPAGHEVGVSTGSAVEELAEDHHRDSPIRELRIPSVSRAHYKSSKMPKKEAWSPLILRPGPPFRSGLRLDGKVVARSPFGPRAVIKRLRRLAQCVEREPDDCGPHPGDPGRDYRLARVNAGAVKCPYELFRHAQAASL